MKYKVIKKLHYGDVVLGEEGDIVDVDMSTMTVLNCKRGTKGTYTGSKDLEEFVLSSLIPYVENDNVNHPSHYTNGEGGIECIDAMISAYGKEAVMCFCKCNAFKYQWRFDKKNGVEDIKKAQWYQNKYIELENEINNRGTE